MYLLRVIRVSKSLELPASFSSAGTHPYILSERPACCLRDLLGRLVNRHRRNVSYFPDLAESIFL